MRIKIDPKITKIEFFAQQDEIPKVIGGSAEKYGPEFLVHTFKNSRLLTDSAAIARLPSVKRDLLARLLEFQKRVVEYDGVEIEWSDIKYPGVWGPSIDTILFARALKKLFKKPNYLKNIGSFLEIGCGSGYLSKYILQKKDEAGMSLHHVHLMDINPDAILCAMTAIEKVRKDIFVSYSLNTPCKPIQAAHSYELIICNPPYVPRPNDNPDNPFEGLFLYGEILNKAEKLMKPSAKLIVNFSSISKTDVFSEFSKKFDIKIIEKMKVPLKIPLITSQMSKESKKWMEYLLKNKKLIVDPSEKTGYKYWHVIEIAECKLRAGSR